MHRLQRAANQAGNAESPRRRGTRPYSARSKKWLSAKIQADQKLRSLEVIVTKKIGTTVARQGETPHIVRYMLAISLAAAVVALAIVGVVLTR